MTSERYYEGVRELYRTLDIQEVNDYLLTGWELLKIAEVQLPQKIGDKLELVKVERYTLGRRVVDASKNFPPSPPAKPDKDMPALISQPQLEYIKVLEKKSQANGSTIVKYLDDHKKNMNTLTRDEASDLIGMLVK